MGTGCFLFNSNDQMCLVTQSWMCPGRFWVCFCVKQAVFCVMLKLWLWIDHRGIQCVGRQQLTSTGVLCNDIREVLWIYLMEISEQSHSSWKRLNSFWDWSSIKYLVCTQNKNRRIKSKRQIVSGINLFCWSELSKKSTLRCKDCIWTCLLMSVCYGAVVLTAGVSWLLVKSL